MKGKRWLRALSWFAGAWALAAHAGQLKPAIQIEYPPEHGVVFGRPHVLIIFDAVGVFRSIGLKVDGRAVPSSAFTFCRICAGSHSVVLTSSAPWGAVEGPHHLEFEGESHDGLRVTAERSYAVDPSRPSSSGLSGHAQLPDGFAPSSTSAIVGGWVKGGRNGFQGLAGLAVKGPASLELGEGWGSEPGFSWKVSASDRAGTFGIAAGEMFGHPYAALSYRTQPSKFEVTAGVGSGSLPHGWLGGSFVLADLTRKWRSGGTVADLLAIGELVSLDLEVDDRGRFDFGATLLHPYGWSIGLYRVNIGSPVAWKLMATYRFSLK